MLEKLSVSISDNFIEEIHLLLVIMVELVSSLDKINGLANYLGFGILRLTKNLVIVFGFSRAAIKRLKVESFPFKGLLKSSAGLLLVLDESS